MPKQLPYYLTGTTHWLTEDKAIAMAIELAPCLTVEESDGTWSVYHLSKTPRVTGQPLYNEPTRRHMLYELVHPGGEKPHM